MKKTASKIIFIFFFLFLTIFGARAQTWAWAKTTDSQASGECYGMCTDNVGNVFITGFFDTPVIIFDSYTLTSSGLFNVYLTKYDANGNVLWAKSSANGSAYIFGNSVSADANGNSFVSGTYSSSTITFGSYTLTNNTGLNHPFLVKYDVNGNVLWARGSIGSGDDYCFGVGSDTGGNAYITGYFYSPTIIFGSYTLTNTGNGNSFLIKYDPSGNVLWAKSTYGIFDDLAYALSVDASGNAYVGGSFSSPNFIVGSYTLTGTATGDIFIAKYDSNGNVLWAKKAIGSADELVFSVSSDAGGNVFITGVFASPTITFGTYTLTNTGGYDIYLTKYDANGNVIWAKSSVGSGYEAGRSVFTNGSSIYLSGSLTNSVAFGAYTLTAPPGAAEPMFIVRYDQSGNITYTAVIGSAGDDVAPIAVDKFCNVYLSGDIDQPSTFIVGTHTITSTVGERIFVAKLVMPQPTITASSSNSIICPGQSATLSASGANTFTWNPGGNGTSIAVTPSVSSTYTVTGTNTVTGCSNSTTLTQNVALCDGVREISVSNKIVISPNPNSGNFNLYVENEIDPDNYRDGKLILLNCLGQKVYEQKIISGENNITINELSTGLYHFIILENNQQQNYGKLIIE